MERRLVSVALWVISTFILADSQLVSAQTTRVSVSSTGEAANHASFAPAVSDNGQVIAFVSMATNLVPDDTNAAFDVVSARSSKARRIFQHSWSLKPLSTRAPEVSLGQPAETR